MPSINNQFQSCCSAVCQFQLPIPLCVPSSTNADLYNNTADMPSSSPNKENNDATIVDKELTARRKSSKANVIFVPGSSPPTVKSLLQESYLYGKLYVGDVILNVNNEVIQTEEDFNRIVNVSGEKPRQLKIRLRRDQFYEIEEKAIKNTDDYAIIEFAIRWRTGGMPVGVLMKEGEGRVIITGTEGGTIAENRFKYGDVITKINGEEKKTMPDVRNAILDSINRTNSLTVRIWRSLQKPPNNAIPEDVRRILQQQRHNRGFWMRNHQYPPAIVSSKERSIQRTSSYAGTHSDENRSEHEEPAEDRVTIQLPGEDDVTMIPVTSSGVQLKKTPVRKGSEKEKE